MKTESIQQGNCNSVADKLRLIADAIEREDSEVAITGFDLAVNSSFHSFESLGESPTHIPCSSLEINISFGMTNNLAGELTAKLMQG